MNASNILNNETDIESYTPYSKRPETYIVPVVFLFIFITGVFGNVTVIYIVIKEKLFNSPSYRYILNLSFGDLIVMLGTVPFVCTIYTFESWPYGEFVCKASEFIRDLSIGVSVFTLSMMSFDRYKAAFSTVIRAAHRNKRVLRSSTGLRIFSIWFISVIFACPAAYNSFLLHYTISNHTITICYPFPNELGTWYPKSVVLIKFLLFYVTPLTIIACCYVSIAVHLINKSKNSAHREFHRSSKRNFTRAKIVLSFVVIFMVCFFPNHLFMIWFYFNPISRQEYNGFWHTWRIVAFVLTFLNSCLNPMTLYITSYHFKRLCNVHVFRCFTSGNVERNSSENLTIDAQSKQLVRNESEMVTAI
ncbi:gastrin-releasing peptide receptor-like protein [Leptotrombidium deliense]|uniref:Gastrin-releasing peptide receptor-like protein n=1 Tax=Leptotrombidium deliense TaxID=299467 RepID=A0A443SNQ5_9ACAR|nr:gastrin-releasing peptide receptor-like protein [Leptotrombidium deliense]